MTATETETKAMFAKLLTPCVCSQVAISWSDDSEPEGTDCQAVTKSQFAPGHDAKLKGLLIRAGAVGADIRVQSGGMLQHTSAENVAAEFGFAKQVAAGIAKAREENEGKGEREAAKAAKAEASAAAKIAKAAEREAAKATREQERAAKAEAKAAADAEKAAAKAAKPKVEDGQEVSAKVGRKIVNGHVEDGVFVYMQGDEEIRTAKFSLV